MKLNELVNAIYLKQFPDVTKSEDLKSLTDSTKARIDEFQKKFKEYNQEYLEYLDDDGIKDYIKKLACNGLRAIDDSEMDKVVDLLSPMIGQGVTLSKRFDRREDEGIYDAKMSEVLIELQDLVTGEFIESSDIMEDFADQIFREELVRCIDELKSQLEDMANFVSNVGQKKASIIDNNRMIPERLKHLAIQIALLKIDIN